MSLNFSRTASQRGPSMTRYICLSLFCAGVAFMPSAALASGNLANATVSQTASTTTTGLTLVEQWEQRLARLEAQQAAGVQFYGNSKIPIANAIAKTKRQLAKFRAAAAAGNPLPPVSGGTSGGESSWPSSGSGGDGGASTSAGAGDSGAPSANPDA